MEAKQLFALKKYSVPKSNSDILPSMKVYMQILCPRISEFQNIANICDFYFGIPVLEVYAVVIDTIELAFTYGYTYQAIDVFLSLVVFTTFPVVQYKLHIFLII